VTQVIGIPEVVCHHNTETTFAAGIDANREIHKMTERKIDADWLIGDVLESYTAAAAVFKKHFGEGCLTCPGARNETVAFGASMHGTDADLVVKEINECIAAEEKV
jgi:hybrid cluster-associated redox disulfide protein